MMATLGKDERAEQLREEVERAASHYYHTPLQLGIDRRTKAFVIERCRGHVRGPRVLELGYVDGQWTDDLVAAGYQVDVVEGAARHVKHARERFSDSSTVRVFHSLFQSFTPDRSYDTVIAGDMLRYLDEPEEFLSRCRDWLNPNGRLIVTLPNSRSLHRRVGAFMQMEPTPTVANQRDLEVGNRRSYDRYELRALLMRAGLEVSEVRGCFLKPLSSAQMAEWDDTMLRAFLSVGEELEDYCWFLYAVAQRGQGR